MTWNRARDPRGAAPKMTEARGQQDAVRTRIPDRARMSSNRRTPTNNSRSTWKVHLSPRICIVREIVQFSVDQRIASGTCSFILAG